MIIGSKIYDFQHDPDRMKNEKAKISCQKVTLKAKQQRILPHEDTLLK